MQQARAIQIYSKAVESIGVRGRFWHFFGLFSPLFRYSGRSQRDYSATQTKGASYGGSNHGFCLRGSLLPDFFRNFSVCDWLHWQCGRSQVNRFGQAGSAPRGVAYRRRAAGIVCNSAQRHGAAIVQTRVDPLGP